MLPLLSTTIYLLIRSLNGVDARAVDTAITSFPTSDISSSILTDSLNVTAALQRCGDIDNCRTLDGIVQSCLATILACAWFAVHRNIPAPQAMESSHPKFYVRWLVWVWRTVVDQIESLKVFLVAFLVPELVLAWAIRQAIVALKLAWALEEVRLHAIEAQKGKKEREDVAEMAASVEGHSRFDRFTTRIGAKLIELFKRVLRYLSTAPSDAACEGCEGNPNQCNLVAGARRVLAKGDECWTWSHGFFVAMGGFHFYTIDGPQYPLSPANVLELVARGHLVPPTANEISDKSKGDWLSKGVAIIQTAWFVVQCIARHTEGLPVTRLEVMTLAYTIVTVAMYVVWWKKPLNVSCAVRVPKEEVAKEEVLQKGWANFVTYMLGTQDKFVDLSQRRGLGVPTFWAGKSTQGDLWIANVTAAGVAMAFGAVHCIAWHSEFQSHLEQELWRWFSIAIIVVPPALFVVNSAVKQIGGVSGVLYIPLIVVYITARIILTILSFTSLRGLPYAAYETVQWTSFVPHI